MLADSPFDAVPCGLAVALEDRGFVELTQIQRAVLDPAVGGRDLRMSSATGSGKTVAIGLVVASEIAGEIDSRTESGHQPGGRHTAPPVALVVAPTRELAAQLGREFAWLYKPLALRLAVVTGGTPIPRDLRALELAPHVVVGTPGRLVDLLRRGSLDLSAVTSVVLDEADEMLDMGFRDDLEALLNATPSERSTHLVSATFPREVLHLANRYQRDAALVEGSKRGAPNEDIRHHGHVIDDREKDAALINVLLCAPRQRTLVFARTRAGTSRLASFLRRSGFSAAMLSGDLGQGERNRTLETFRAGATDVLVATDVAARGLDIEQVAQVVHYDLPETAEILTHRSGRTGRAGNKGNSIVLVSPSRRRRAESMFRTIGVETAWAPVPTVEQVRRAAQSQMIAELSAPASAGEAERALARELLENGDAEEIVASLLARARLLGPCEPRTVREPSRAPASQPMRPARGSERPAGPARGRRRDDREYTRFHINWGANHGANPNRLLAMICRRGGVRSNHIGAIKITDFSSMVDVAKETADEFARAAGKPDPRNPKVRVRPWSAEKPERSHRGTPSGKLSKKLTRKQSKKPPKRSMHHGRG